jgi:hypothetical protein
MGCLWWGSPFSSNRWAWLRFHLAAVLCSKPGFTQEAVPQTLLRLMCAYVPSQVCLCCLGCNHFGPAMPGVRMHILY